MAKKLLDRSTEEEYYPHKTVSKDRHADIGEYDYEEGSEIWRKLAEALNCKYEKLKNIVGLERKCYGNGIINTKSHQRSLLETAVGEIIFQDHGKGYCGDMLNQP